MNTSTPYVRPLDITDAVIDALARAIDPDEPPIVAGADREAVREVLAAAAPLLVARELRHLAHYLGEAGQWRAAKALLDRAHQLDGQGTR